MAALNLLKNHPTSYINSSPHCFIPEFYYPRVNSKIKHFVISLAPDSKVRSHTLVSASQLCRSENTCRADRAQTSILLAQLASASWFRGQQWEQYLSHCKKRLLGSGAAGTWPRTCSSSLSDDYLGFLISLHKSLLI